MFPHMSFKDSMKWVLVLAIVLTVVTMLLSGCGEAPKTSTSPDNGASGWDNSAQATAPVDRQWVEVDADGTVRRVCDKEYGNLIYKYNGNDLVVIKDGCERNGQVYSPPSSSPTYTQ